MAGALPAKTCCSLVFYPPVTTDQELQSLGRTSVGDDKRVDLLRPVSSRGEISLSQEHIRVLFALHRALFASCTPSVGNVLVARSETWMGSSAWEQTNKVPPCMALQVRYSAHTSKRILKK